MNLTFRDAHDDDLEWLYELTRASYEEVVARQLGSWDEDFQRKACIAKWKGGCGKIVEQGKDRLGAVMLEELEDHDLLREVQIKPQYQNQGIGTRLILDFAKAARARGRPLRLRIMFENVRAKKLYERLGFVVVGKLEHQHLMELR